MASTGSRVATNIAVYLIARAIRPSIDSRYPGKVQASAFAMERHTRRPLNACGYRVLTRAADAGVDMFIKQQKSLFVFFQGHPEYESSTLLLEYRRDVSRYLRGETDTYPSIPRGYFDDDTMIRLSAIQQEAKANPRDEIRLNLAESWKSYASKIHGTRQLHTSIGTGCNISAPRKS